MYALESAGIARMSHVSLESADLDAAVDWYRRVFGYQVILDKENIGEAFETIVGVPGARSRMVRGLIGGNAVVQIFWHSWREPQEEKRTLMSFEVRDAQAAYAALEQEGVYRRSEPVEFDNCFAFVIADLDGNPIEIIQWKPEMEPYRVPEP